MIEAGFYLVRVAIIENALRLQENAPQSLASICVRYAFGPRGLSVNILMRAYERAPRRSLCCSRMQRMYHPALHTCLLPTVALGIRWFRIQRSKTSASINAKT